MYTLFGNMTGRALGFNGRFAVFLVGLLEIFKKKGFNIVITWCFIYLLIRAEFSQRPLSRPSVREGLHK